MDRTTINIELWPRGMMFEGKRTDPSDRFKCHAPVKIELPPGDLELLLAEYKATPEPFEQEAARSIAAALREWNEAISVDVEDDHPACYASHEEHRVEPATEETPNYETD